MCRRSSWLCFFDSNSIIVHGDLNPIMVSSRHMFNPVYQLTWINVGGGCYRVVSEHGSPLGLAGQCVGHAFISVAYVFSMLVVYMNCEVIVCILCHRDDVDCYDDNVLAKIELEMQISKRDCNTRLKVIADHHTSIVCLACRYFV